MQDRSSTNLRAAYDVGAAIGAVGGRHGGQRKERQEEEGGGTGAGHLQQKREDCGWHVYVWVGLHKNGL